MKKNPEPVHHRQFPVMGTLSQISVYGLTQEKAAIALDAAQKKIYEVEKLCSIFRKESPLSRINQRAAAEKVDCPEELFALLEQCRFFYQWSGGAFDVTIRPLMQLWGFYRKRKSLPSQKEIQKALQTVSFSYVELHRSERKVSFRKEGVSLDLGGIAKGYALDLAADELKNSGVKKFILNLGGNILCRNEDLSDSPFRIGIRHPEKPLQIWKHLQIRNGAVATSGNYERFVIIDGKRYSHIMDPRTGKVVDHTLSVTVVTPRGMDSDALSTAVFVKGVIPPNLPPQTQVYLFPAKKN